jgi:[ribosomal protein S5]-alanine N-acetyltransferase
MGRNPEMAAGKALVIGYPRLKTERLLLRRLETDDAERVQALANVHDIARMITPMPYPYTLDEARDWITLTHSEMAMKSAYAFAIVLQSTGELIGAVEVGNEFRNQRGELGYWMGKPYWGHGYMTEAARRVLQFGFETLGLNRVYATHYTSNPASGRVMQKIGMTYEGTLRGHVLKWGEPVDLVCYSILRQEFDREQIHS